MKILLKIFFLSVVFLECAYSQSPYWQRIYGLNSNRFSKSAIETYDGGYLILNEGKSGSGYSCNVIKTDRFGVQEFERNYFTNTTNGVIQTKDSGFVFVGVGNFKASAFKINKLLDSIWYKEYGTSINDKFIDVKQFTNGDLLFVGFKSTSNFTSGAFVIRTNSSGESIWENIITDSLYEDIRAYDMLIEINSNIVITGFGNSDFPANSDLFIFKLTPNGKNYLKKFIYTFPRRESGVRIINSYDGNYIISGGASSPGVCSHFTKVDTSGMVLNQQFFSNCTNYITHSNDKNYMMGGTVQNDQIYQYALRKVDPDGNEIWLRILNGGWSRSYLENFSKTEDGGFLFAGAYQDSITEMYSPYVAKTDSEGNASIPINIYDQTQSFPNDFIMYPAYPNPFNTNVVIKFNVLRSGTYKLILFDISGRIIKEIFNRQFSKGNFKENLYDVFTQLPSSVYFVSLYSSGKTLTQKLLFIK